MKTNLTIRPATVDDQDFLIGLVPRFVELCCPPGREPIQVTDAIAQEIYQALASPAQDCAFFIAQDIDSRRLGFIYLQSASDPFTQNMDILLTLR